MYLNLTLLQQITETEKLEYWLKKILSNISYALDKHNRAETI